MMKIPETAKMLAIWRSLNQLRFLFLAILPAFLFAGPAKADEVSNCRLIVQTARGAQPSNPDTEYMLSVGSLFRPVLLTWFEDGSVCGGVPHGPIRFEGMNYAEGRLTAHVLSNMEGQARKLLYSAGLRKRKTDRVIVWEGMTQASGGSDPEPIYIKRIRDTDFDAEVPRTNDMQRNREFQLREGHGAYYCGDGGCEGPEVDVWVECRDEDVFVRRLQQSNIDYTSYRKLEEHCDNLRPPRPVAPRLVPGFGEGTQCTARDLVDSRVADAGCSIIGWVHFEVVAMPLREPEVTMALRALLPGIGARRRGGDAATYSDSFELHTTQFLSNANNLDANKAASFFGGAMRSYYPGSADYDISDPIFQNNALYWSIIGRRTALTRRRNASPAERAEWWKVRVQLIILQKNFGEYFMSLGLPETRVTTWGFPDFPSDAKFQTELTNDQRFLDFRNRLMGALTKDVAGGIFIP